MVETLSGALEALRIQGLRASPGRIRWREFDGCVRAGRWLRAAAALSQAGAYDARGPGPVPRALEPPRVALDKAHTLGYNAALPNAEGA